MSVPEKQHEQADSQHQETAIRERAYVLWEAEGRPEGRMDEYWYRARDLLEREADEAQRSSRSPEAAAEARKDEKNGEFIRKDTDVKNERAARREKDGVTKASEDSFPASDPPSYMAGSAISGSPPYRKSDEPDADEVRDGGNK